MESSSASDPAPRSADSEPGQFAVVLPNSGSISSPVKSSAPDLSQLSRASSNDAVDDDKDHAIVNASSNPTTPHTSDSTPNSRARAPSPPRWRFVNEAKKSLGYSSHAAGQVVVGKSAQELGAEYTPPTITKREKNEQREIGKLVVKEWDVEEEITDEEGIAWKRQWADMTDAKEGVEEAISSGTNSTEIEQSDDSAQMKKDECRPHIGKLLIDEENPSEEIPSTQATLIQENDAIRSLKTPDKLIDEKELTTDAALFSEEAPPPISESPVTSKENLSVEVGGTTTQPKSRKTRICTALWITVLVIAAIVLGVLFGSNYSANGDVDKKRASFIIADEITSSDSPSLVPSGQPTTEPSEYPSNYPSAHTSTLSSKISSAWPSSTPHSATKAGCPPGMLLFSMEYNITVSKKHNESPAESPIQNTKEKNDNVTSTWILRDACSGDALIDCSYCLNTNGPTSRPTADVVDTIFQPSSTKSKFSPPNVTGDERKRSELYLTNSTSNSDISEKSNLFQGSQKLDGLTQTNETKILLPIENTRLAPKSLLKCLPSTNQYVFEIHDASSQEGSCCDGFDKTTYSLLFGNVKIIEGGEVRKELMSDDEDVKISAAEVKNHTSTSQSNVGVIMFGAMNASCPSRVPSSTPTQLPSLDPFIVTTKNPSALPSNAPNKPPSIYPPNIPIQMSSIAPSDSPIGVPSSHPSNEPSSDPSIQRSGFPSKMPSIEPTEHPSAFSSMVPSRIPSKSPSESPSQSSSKLPSQSPSTRSPTTSPFESIGGCPSPFIPLTYYPIGTLVEQNGLVYECIDYSCGSYSFEPGSTTAWTVVGSCNGTIAPTKVPSYRPSDMPSLVPTVASSEDPSSEPSATPSNTFSSIPSQSPSILPTQPKLPTQFPTFSPIPFVGECPPPFESLSYYSIGTLISLNGFVFKCIDYSCGSFGFDPNPFDESGGNQWLSAWEIAGTCESVSPTSSPTTSPSLYPAIPLTERPTGSPTARKIESLHPSQLPSHPPSLIPSIKAIAQLTIDPTVTSKESLDPTEASFRTPWLLPSLVPSGKPLEEPSANPTARKIETMDPTEPPFQIPSIHPSLVPTELKTTKPTCRPGDANFNVCFAIDQSGSVCNGDFSGFDCIDCQPAFYCNSPGVDSGTCCNNFQNVTDFARDTIISLDELASDSRFSIVQFSTTALLASELSTADETLTMLNGMLFSGGLTNHADAIRVCQESFQAADKDSDLRNLIVLITDGAPTYPEYMAEEEALAAAIDAKSAGSYIIPVLISPIFNAFTNDRLEFMESIKSGEGDVLNVENFEGLDSLLESLLGQISCEV
mmetsp:Transcript_555/g.964  ORF Transcript_555/g.964 Transcript_555/m.964 type:complete len:1315 (-) Transcript_555:115-4059(-)